MDSDKYHLILSSKPTCRCFIFLISKCKFVSSVNPFQIWSRNRIKAADFLGLATIPFIGKGTPEVQECKLYGRGKKEAEIKRPGKLFVEITTDDDLTAL